jgi:hypothetical protein
VRLVPKGVSQSESSTSYEHLFDTLVTLNRRIAVVVVVCRKHAIWKFITTVIYTSSNSPLSRSQSGTSVIHDLLVEDPLNHPPGHQHNSWAVVTVLMGKLRSTVYSSSEIISN